MIIFLIGYMGSGKTTLGKKLAGRLGCQFVDLDQEIERREGLSINDIFSNFGEAEFRQMETLLLSEVISDNKNQVISCGGGTPCFNNNMELMKREGKTIYLRLTPAALFSRVRDKRLARPLLKDKSDEELLDYIKKTLAERERWYLESDIILNALGLSTEEVIRHLN